MPGNVRVAIGLPQKTTDEHFVLAKQMGCEEVVLATPADLPGTERWEYEDLARLRERVEGFGLKIGAIQNTPPGFFNDARLGLPGADKAIANYQETIRNVGRAGIPVLAYNFRPDPLYRTGHIPGRGGALVTEFDRSKARDLPLTYGREFSADEMWANYERFIKAVLPVAEESGVRLALHPDDPPVDRMNGVAKIFTHYNGIRQADEIAGRSPFFGLTFCVGTWSEGGRQMGKDVFEMIDDFGGRGKIFTIHFRNVTSTMPHFSETFPDEGYQDMYQVMKALRRVRFAGSMVPDHIPALAGDASRRAGLAYCIAYMRALLRRANEEVG